MVVRSRGSTYLGRDALDLLDPLPPVDALSGRQRGGNAGGRR